jgi:hypothetical protein
LNKQIKENEKMKTYSRKFGKYHVEVIGHRISIVGDYNSNFGIFYTHAIDRFKRHPISEEHNWNRPQVMGMEWDYGLVPKVREWLYKLVMDGKITENK